MRAWDSQRVIAEFLSGKRIECGMVQTGDGWQCSIAHDGWDFLLRDVCDMTEDGLRIVRTVTGKRTGETAGADRVNGIRIGFRVPADTVPDGAYRFCIPSMVYTKPQKLTEYERRTYMEDRLTCPMVLTYCADTGEYQFLSKENPSELTEAAEREKGDSRYLQRTDNVSLGYMTGIDRVCFESFWPYGEEDKSSALSADERPAVAFYPMTGKSFEKMFVYRLEKGRKESFAEAVYEAYEKIALRLEESGQRVVQLPFTVEESRQYRMHALAKSYREFEHGGAGFFFHFDPLYGYGSRPSGFSSSYDTIPHNSYTHILEYGFTGRQINAACIMAAERGGSWIGRGERVIEFFLDHCLLENGWVYSLFDLDTGAPFFSFGDPDAPKLHYISRTLKKGNYLRTMTEPMNDLLECYRWYAENGREHERWRESVFRYADFLVGHQNEDGSWFRAYCPDGEGTDSIERPGQSGEEFVLGQKSVTSIPLVFLSNLCRMLREEAKTGERAGQKNDSERLQRYQESAVRAGDYVLSHMVCEEHYQGATLDNPNQVDKEAAQYVMAGLCHLYLLTGEEKYLLGAENAAFIFITWNYIWNAPMQKGTILYEKGFRTKGLGAINSVWGGGVVDIYSLFHIRELFLIGKFRNHPLMCRMAEWTATATAQILSCPADDMGFADIGMQPEGFGICPQGIDEGMIQKGDIWGTLGWIYSAGIYGLKNYLSQKEAMRNGKENVERIG